ncbi:hypothetical protein QWY82_04640 [Simiduia curdlanivorans]|uniref:Lipoprotein n=1 Tax=Simiduia curdlanivorans TaxID=1492769 RepID=A0ABV8UZE8_9GAMM|nr:hypothetical protein [Simiduia curdlanivorans]MDN3638095.1 hypothetical protein [Simiduia curdlanivorans]
MKYFTSLGMAALLTLLCACNPKVETATLKPSPLAELLAPTLASAIRSADAAINTALEKPDYETETVKVLTKLKVSLAHLEIANQLVISASAESDSLDQLASHANEVHQLRSFLEADIIALKDTNAAAAIRLGVVNELSEFCELTALDLRRALSPTGF